MCSLILIINIRNCFYINDKGIYIQYIVTSIVSLPAVYYIYNYCNLFFRIKNSILVDFTYIFGAIVIVSTYFFIDLWGVFMGLEIITLAISINVTLVNSTYQKAQEQFRKDSFIFGMIGLVIVILGFVFNWVFGLSDNVSFSNRLIAWILKYSYYLQFTVYALASVCVHINYRYIMSKIGYANIIEDIDGE